MRKEKGRDSNQKLLLITILFFVSTSFLTGCGDAYKKFTDSLRGFANREAIIVEKDIEKIKQAADEIKDSKEEVTVGNMQTTYYNYKDKVYGIQQKETTPFGEKKTYTLGVKVGSYQDAPIIAGPTYIKNPTDDNKFGVGVNLLRF